MTGNYNAIIRSTCPDNILFKYLSKIRLVDSHARLDEKKFCIYATISNLDTLIRLSTAISTELIITQATGVDGLLYLEIYDDFRE